MLTPTTPNSSALADAPGPAEVAGEEVGGEARLGGVGERQGLVLGLEPEDGGHRPERLLAARSASSRVAPISTVGSKNVPPSGCGRPPTAMRAPRCDRVGDVVADLRRPPPGSIERSLLDLGFEAVADASGRPPPRAAPRTRRGCRPARARGSRTRRSARRCGTSRRSRPPRRVEVGVVEDDQRRVAPQLQRDLLHRPRALAISSLPTSVEPVKLSARTRGSE